MAELGIDSPRGGIGPGRRTVWNLESGLAKSLNAP